MKIETMIIEPLKEMMVGVISFIPGIVTLFIALFVLAIGWIVAQFVTKMLVHFFRAVKLDKGCDKIGLIKVMKKGGIKEKPSTQLGCIAYWLMMVVVLMTTVKSFGLGLAGDFLTTILAYLPHVVTGTLTLIVGMLIAKVVATLVYVTAKNTDMPIPETLRDLSKFAIVVYVAIIYLKQIGLISLFDGHYQIFMTGIVFALALAFGLAGKDVASKYLHVLDKKS